MKKLIVIGSVLLSVSALGQSYTEIVKAVANDREADDNFGYAVTIDGNWAAIGAYSDDFGGANPNMGSVYIFEQQGLNNWVQVQKLSASDQDDYDRFGWSVDIHGDFLVVGAYGEDDDENNANPLSKAGSAYFFKNINGTWTEMQKVVASDRDVDDEFGWSVAIYDSTAIIGAHIEDHDAVGGNYKYHAGSVYSFTLGTNNIWTQTQKICAADRWVDMNYPNGYSGEDLADQFGGSVDIWGDWMVVGAHHHDYATTSPLSGALWSSGAAYIFERTAGVWNQVKKVQNFDRESWDRFGYDVAIDSNIIAICAYSEDEMPDGVSDPLTNPGSVYIFERNGSGIWNHVQKIVPNDRSSGDHFGYSISIDDTLMVLGCHSDDHDEFAGDLKTDAGSAYIFKNNGGTWSQFQKIDASDRVTEDDLGISVGISGHTVLVGAQYQDFNELGLDSITNAGAAYFYSNKQCSTTISNNSATICFGDTYAVGSIIHSTTGYFEDTLTSIEGCDSIINTTLTVDAAIIEHQYASMCNGGTYYIFGTPTTTPGNYSYLLTAQNGCDSTIITHLTMDPPITSEQWVSICWGESYSIGLNTYHASGIYEDVVSATNFCDSTITTHLTVEFPTDVSISQDNNLLTANETAASYQWFKCNPIELIPAANSQTYAANEIGTYGVIVTKNGCSDTSACVYVDELSLNDHQHEFSIFPNPTSGAIMISPVDPAVVYQILLTDQSGKTVFASNINQSNTALDLRSLEISSGTYFLTLITSTDVSREKIIFSK
ncbi:MAG: T9SS type A sorting domain-containing protein [Crocinitomicaceae bacterium]|nr:T9SS type A sorting domain-containing protein [Crocinitomicaceae bacterium]